MLNPTGRVSLFFLNGTMIRREANKICIIDDNVEDRAVFRRYLLQDAEYRYVFFEEGTGKKGLELCRAIQPDCILLNYNLPDIDGLEFLTELSDELELVPFPVIVLTDLDNEAAALKAMKRGAQYYLVKDEMTQGNLLRAIHNAVEREAMRRMVEKQHQDLELKNQEMEAFAYALAHDLRSPLRAISSFGQIVAQDYSASLDEEGRRYIDIIVRSSMQMDRLIDELLKYTRIEHRSVRTKPVDLAYLIPHIVAELATRNAEATVLVADQLPVVDGDPVLLNQVFVNLVENALTYHKPDVQPSIAISWQREEPYAIISIKDNGIGIAPKHQAKIFNIFQRLHGDEEYAGTGIGLAIVKKATELMDGMVWVESAPEQGSCFYVKLPLSQDMN